MRFRTVPTMLGALLLATVAVAGPASAQDAYPTEGTSTGQGSVSNSTVQQGESVTFSGGGFDDAVVLNLAINGVPAGTTTTDSAGNFSVELTPTECGRNTLSATGEGAGGETRTVTAAVTVTCTETAGSALPRTGSDVTTTALVAGIVLVAIGSIFVLGARTRMRRPLA